MCLHLCLFSAILLSVLYLRFGAFELVFENIRDLEFWQVGMTYVRQSGDCLSPSSFRDPDIFHGLSAYQTYQPSFDATSKTKMLAAKVSIGCQLHGDPDRNRDRTLVSQELRTVSADSRT